MAAAAIEDQLAAAIGEPRIALGVVEIGAHLEESARVESRAGQVAGLPLVGFAHVEDLVAAAIGAGEQVAHGFRRDLGDLAERVVHEIR